MLDRSILQLLHHRITGQKDRVFSATGFWLHRTGGHICFDPHILQIVFKVFQLGINPFITLFFCSIYIVQFVKDHLERLIQRIKTNTLRPIFAHALYTKISIDQQQRFRGKVLEFQIPCGMVAGDMSRHRHLFPEQKFIGIIIMEIRDSLFLFRRASELSQIVTCRRRRNEGQIHRYIRLCQLFSNKQCHVMHASDMPHSIERCDFPADPHEFIDIMIVPEFSQPVILPGSHASVRRFFWQKIQIIYRRKLSVLPLICQHRAIVFQEKQDSPSAVFRYFSRKIFRIQGSCDRIANKMQPSVLRRIRQSFQNRFKSLNHTGRCKIFFTSQLCQPSAPACR